MQNNYVKELAKRSFQEGPVKAPYKKRKGFNQGPNIFIGVFASVMLSAVVYFI
ncbi:MULTISPECIES: hypothetical protein [unclassified Agarivorans]|uniref:hypothetical protein n=1 Tax=unclassified Agarivorans TaxID=2636026 RepID=UPI003D7D2430